MEIFVCVTRVPDVSEVEIELDRSGRSVVEDDFDFGINEWDNFAVEEAVRLKEALGGSVLAVTIGDEEAEEVLRRALAMGADEALHLCDPAFEEGALDTGFIEKHLGDPSSGGARHHVVADIAAAIHAFESSLAGSTETTNAEGISPWQLRDGAWRS